MPSLSDGSTQLSPTRVRLAILALALAALTQLVYPYLYGRLLAADPFLVAVLTVRNIGYVVLLCWALHAVVTAGRRAGADTNEHRRTGGATMAPTTSTTHFRE